MIDGQQSSILLAYHKVEIFQSFWSSLKQKSQRSDGVCPVANLSFHFEVRPEVLFILSIHLYSRGCKDDIICRRERRVSEQLYATINLYFQFFGIYALIRKSIQYQQSNTFERGQRVDGTCLRKRNRENEERKWNSWRDYTALRNIFINMIDLITMIGDLK